MDKKLTKKQEVIRLQLLLRAVVWDIFQIEEEDEYRLKSELKSFGLPVIQIREQAETNRSREKYKQAAACLSKLGILEKEALLITEDDDMAEYAYRQRDTDGYSGMGVVCYETETNRKDVSADMIVLGFEEIGIQFLDRVLKRRNGVPWNILYTERTMVREITLDDLDELYALYDGEGITDYTEPLYERQKEEAYTSSYIAYMYYYYGYGMWIVRDRKTGALVGRAGIEHRDIGNEVLMELGYLIGKQYQKKGYATEVCEAILAYAKEEIGINELHCFIHPDNHASLHLAKKLGFQMAENFDSEKEEFMHLRMNLR